MLNSPSITSNFLPLQVTSYIYNLLILQSNGKSTFKGMCSTDSVFAQAARAVSL